MFLATLVCRARCGGDIDGKAETGRFSHAADGYHRTLAGFLSGTGQIGRQYTPVVSTPAKTRPSKRRSRLRMACQQIAGSSSGLSRAVSSPRTPVDPMGVRRFSATRFKGPICHCRPIFRVHPRAATRTIISDWQN